MFIVMEDQASENARVVKFRRPGGVRTPSPGRPPVPDLVKYEHTPEADDYGHRMLVNAAAFAFVLGLIGAGIWLAESMAELRRIQDCVLAGHRDCAPLEAVRQRD